MNIIQDIDVKNKNVLLRIDSDVKIENGEVKNDRRLRASIPTIKHLLYNDAKVTIIGHIGRPARQSPDGSRRLAGGPEGKEDRALRMFPVEEKLIELIGTHLNWQILENLRFDPREEKNDSEFAKELSTGQDLFVQDAFASCHREHASTSAITKILPSYAGLSIQKEIENLEKLLKTNEKPFTIILGGAKISDKLPVLKNLTSRAQNFLIGGMMANTFLTARRHHLGDTNVEKNLFREANIIWQNIIDEKDRSIYLPIDLVVSKSIKEPIETMVVKTSDALNLEFLKEYFVVDIGPETARKYEEVIIKSNTVFWNGNMGISEIPEFANGTNNIAKAIMSSSSKIVIGGGDTVTACDKIGIKEKDNLYFSTGGGATLEFLAGKELPGLKALGYYE